MCTIFEYIVGEMGNNNFDGKNNVKKEKILHNVLSVTPLIMVIS